MQARLLQTWRDFIARRHPETGRSLDIVHKRLYILPSRAGLGFAFLVLLSLIGAINYQLSMGFFFTFLLVGIGNAAMLRTYAALLGLQVRSDEAGQVFAGEQAPFSLILHDTRGRNRYGICLITPQGLETKADVPAHGQARLTVFIPAMRRGYLRLPRCRMACSNPSGWFSAWTYIALQSECLVYPAPEQNPPPLPQGVRPQGQGRLAGGGDDDFSGLRSYQTGDAPSRLAWKQLARSDELLSKRFESPHSSEIQLDWQMLAGLATEARISRLTAWVLQAEKQGLAYSLNLPGFYQPVGNGIQQQAQCLRALALFELSDEGVQ